MIVGAVGITASCFAECKRGKVMSSNGQLIATNLVHEQDRSSQACPVTSSPVAPNLVHEQDRSP